MIFEDLYILLAKETSRFGLPYTKRVGFATTEEEAIKWRNETDLTEPSYQNLMDFIAFNLVDEAISNHYHNEHR